MNVDPLLVQMTLLDDITHSSLMGENSKCKSQITRINRLFLVSKTIALFVYAHVCV